MRLRATNSHVGSRESFIPSEAPSINILRFHTRSLVCRLHWSGGLFTDFSSLCNYVHGGHVAGDFAEHAFFQTKKLHKERNFGQLMVQTIFFTVNQRTVGVS